MNIVKNSNDFIRRIEDDNVLTQEQLNILYRAHVIGSIKGVAYFMELLLTPIVSIQTLGKNKVIESRILFDKRTTGKYTYTIEKLKGDKVYLSDKIEQVMDYHFSDENSKPLTHDIIKSMNFAFIDSFLTLYGKVGKLESQQWKILNASLLEELVELNPKLQSGTLVYVNTKQLLGLKN